METAAEDKLSPEQEAMLKKLEVVEQARQDEIARIKQSNCERATGVLAKLTSKGRIRLRDDNGQETAMTEDERESRIADAQRDMVQNCEATG